MSALALRLAAAIGASVVVTTPALAQSGAELIRQLFGHVEATMRDQGRRLTRVAEFSHGLNEGQEAGDIIRLDAGRTYTIVGVCDEDCSDFDLQVRDTNARVVGSDFLDDDTPIVTLERVSGGAYQVQSMMADCEIEPCLTGVRVYRVD